MWRRLNGQEVTNLKEELLNEIEVQEEKGHELLFYVGGDSQYHKTHIVYTVAVVMRFEGKGGIVYYDKTKELSKGISRQQRLFRETYLAVETALMVQPILEEAGHNISEIHTDLNPNKTYLSNDMVQSCLGYISGMGFDGKIKPDSWAAYCIADSKTKSL